MQRFRVCTVILVVLLALQFGGAHAGFWSWLFGWDRPSRECINPGQCTYDNGLASQNLLSCNGVCVCRSSEPMMDAPFYQVFWDPVAARCNMAESGPCGVSRDGLLTLACQPGLDCIEKRCRDPVRLGKARQGSACYDDVDCEPGLICKIVKFGMGPMRSCELVSNLPGTVEDPKVVEPKAVPY